ENAGQSGILLGQDTEWGYLSLTDNPQMFESIDSSAYGNVVINAGDAGIGTWGSSGALIENNTIVNAATAAQTGILIKVAEHYPAPDYPEIDRPCANLTIRNNTVVQSDPKAHPLVQI